MKFKPRAFTLIELMAVVAVFSLGIVIIYQSFFTVINAYSYCRNSLDVRSWVEQKFWNLQDTLNQYGNLVTQQTSGEFEIRGKKIQWELIYNLIEKIPDRAELYAVQLNVQWNEGHRIITMTDATNLLGIKNP